MINVNIKMLNGDLVSIQHKPSKGFQHFLRTVYDMCPHIPRGCLVLKRINDDEKNEDVEDVEDDDQLFAFVDISRVRPIVDYGGNACIPEDKQNKQKRVVLDQFDIKFYSTKEFDEEYGEYFYYGEINVFCNQKEKIFAITDTFQAPTPQESSCYHRDGLGAPYRPTEKTRWFTTIHECLLSLENARFPQDEKTLSSIQTEIEMHMKCIYMK